MKMHVFNPEPFATKGLFDPVCYIIHVQIQFHHLQIPSPASTLRLVKFKCPSTFNVTLDVDTDELIDI